MHDAVEIVRRGRWYVLAVLLGVLAGSYVYTRLVTPEYEAGTILLVETGHAGSSASGVLDAGVSAGLESSDRSLSNQILLLRQSLLIAERTARRLLQLEQMAARDYALPVLRTDDGAPLALDDLAARLQGRIISIGLADTDTDAIEIVARSSSPHEAALIANTYAQEYVQRTQETSRLRITASRRFLEEQVSKYRTHLDAIEEQVQQYMGGQQAIALDDEAEHTITQIAQLEAKQDEARINSSLHEASLKALEDELEELHPGLTQRVASGVEREIELTQAKIAQLELFVEQIYQANPQQRNDPTDPELQSLLEQVRSLRQRVGTLSRQYVDEVLAAGGIDLRNDDAGTAYIANLRQRIADERIASTRAAAQIEALERRLNEYRRRLRSIPEHSIELAQLQRSRQSTEQVYVSLTEKLQEARLAEEAELGFAYIVRRAATPTTPVHPDTRRTMALGLLVGLMLGLGAAFARHRLDTRIYTPDDLHNHGYKLTGTIPDLRYYLEDASSSSGRLRLQDDWHVSEKVIMLHRPVSSAAEAYRHLYINLCQLGSARTVRSVLITSSEEGAGKSTTAVNLALAAAQAGQRTLLLDADAFRPTTHTLLGLDQSIQLNDVLRGDVGRPHLRDLDLSALATPVADVYALGLSGTKANGRIRSTLIRQLMAELTEQFDLVVVDSSPVLGTTDALVLTGVCDATVLVVASGSTRLDALDQAARDLRDAGGKVTGTVLNAFDPTYMLAYASTYYYRYEYSHRTPKQLPPHTHTPANTSAL